MDFISFYPAFVVLGTSLAISLIGWLVFNWTLFLNEARKNQQTAHIISLVSQAVQMVEQQFGSLDSESKKEEATKWVMEQAKLLGYYPDELFVSGLIEAAVYTLKSIK